MLDRGMGGTYVDLPFLEDLHILVVGGWNSLVTNDPAPFQQNMVGLSAPMDVLELIHGLLRPYS